jgi:hypothetical protein
MLQFFRRSQSSKPTSAIQQALVQSGLPADIDPATLSVLQQQGSYSGRRVRYFRVFNPARSAERGITVQQFSDLDRHPELIVGSGHTEHDGAVVLSMRADAATHAGVSRTGADRALHADDDAVVFPVRAE